MRSDHRILAIATIVAIVMSIAVASAAVTCDKTQIVTSSVQGTAATSQSISCVNSDTSTTANIQKSGSYFSLDSSFILPNATRIIVLTFDSAAPSGNNLGAITFSESGSSVVNVLMVVNSTQQVGCQINPSLVSYSQAIQQGTRTPIPTITFSPTNCPGTLSLTASSVSVQGGIITTEGQKPISISSVTSEGVNLVIDTSGLTTQTTYTSTLNINAFSKNFQVPFNIIITSGTSQPANVTLSTLPTCSLTATVLNLNSTYSLICSNIQPDISISPVVDTDYIVGAGVETSSNQFIWKFQPIKFGNTFIKANFNYRNAPIGTPFKQEVKVSSSGIVAPGTLLGFLFTPSLDTAQSNQDIAIQLVDNKSGSLVPNPEIYIDARLLNGTGNTFYTKLDYGKSYQLRGRSPGYDDIIFTMQLQSKQQNISLSPPNPDSGTTILLTSSVPNASIFIDETKVTNPYSGTLSRGSHVLRAIKEGYLDASLNITVLEAVNVSLLTQFKKGTPQMIQLNRNVSWAVNYQKDYASLPTPFAQGTSNVIQFTPDKAGIYSILSNGNPITTYEIKGFSLDYPIAGIQWYWWLLIGIVVIVVLKKMFGDSSSDDPVGFGAPIRSS